MTAGYAGIGSAGMNFTLDRVSATLFVGWLLAMGLIVMAVLG